LVLKTKKLDIGEPKAILGLALAPPNLDEIERTILSLKEVYFIQEAFNNKKNYFILTWIKEKVI